MWKRADLFEKLRTCELYELARESIEKLIVYLSVPVEPGSLAFFFGFRAFNNSCEEDLMFFARRDPNDLRGCPSVEEAVEQIQGMCQAYENQITELGKIIEGGVEKYLAENMDMVDEYYVLSEARDKELDQYIEKKPETLEEMHRLAGTNNWLKIIPSAWREVYGDLFKLYFLREQVGFDRAQFNVDIKSIDVKRLRTAKKEYQGKDYSELPRIIVEYVDPDNDKDLPMDLPIDNHSIKKIEVTLSHYVTFLFQKNNSPIEEDGIPKRDIYLLKTTVEPQKGFEVLGNIGNYSYDEMGLVIQQSIMDLEELTGIELDHDTVRLNDVELNLTFRQQCDFNELMRSVSYYQNYTRKGYVTKEYKAADEGIVTFCADMSDCTDEDAFQKKKRKIEHSSSRMKTIGFTTAIQSLQVKLYDKKEETIATAASQKYDLRIEGDESIIRLEFRIRNREQLKRYFDTGKNPVFFCDLSQEKIEKTYRNLVDIFFKKTYEEGYVPEAIETLKNIVATLNTNQKGGRWKQKLIDDIRSQEVWQKSTPALLSEKDITSVISYNHTFKRNPEKYKKILWDLLKESDVYQKGQEHSYDMLYNFLNKTYNFNTLSPKRRVGFAVSNQGEKLPYVEEDIKTILSMRTGIYAIQNMDHG